MRLQLAALPSYLRRDTTLIALAWSSIALIAAFQGLVLAQLHDRELAASLLKRVSIVPLWALATPLVFRSVRRFPAFHTRPFAIDPLLLALHVGLGSLFIAFANFAIQLPPQINDSSASIVQSALKDIAENYPAALVVYFVIVALGHFRARSPGEGQPDCLTIRQWNRVHFVRFDDIDWIEAEDNYVVVRACGRAYKGRDRISDVEAKLDPKRFVRIHRSTIVHAAKIREVQPLTHRDHAVIMRDGTVLRASRARRRALSDALSVQL